MRFPNILSVFLLLSSLSACVTGVESPSVHWLETESGFLVEYRDRAGLLVKRIEMNRDSITHGCYEIYTIDGQPKLQAYFSDGILYGSWYATVAGCQSGGELMQQEKEGIWEYHASVNGNCTLSASLSFRNGVMYGGQFRFDSINGNWIYSFHDGTGEKGRAVLKGESNFDLRGLFYFFDLGRSPAADEEIELMLYVADIPGLTPVISVLDQSEDEGVLLIEIKPFRYENRMFVWSVDSLREAGTADAGLVDLKLLDKYEYDVHRDLVYLLPFSAGAIED